MPEKLFTQEEIVQESNHKPNEPNSTKTDINQTKPLAKREYLKPKLTNLNALRPVNTLKRKPLNLLDKKRVERKKIHKQVPQEINVSVRRDSIQSFNIDNNKDVLCSTPRECQSPIEPITAEYIENLNKKFIEKDSHANEYITAEYFENLKNNYIDSLHPGNDIDNMNRSKSFVEKFFSGEPVEELATELKQNDVEIKSEPSDLPVEIEPEVAPTPNNITNGPVNDIKGNIQHEIDHGTDASKEEEATSFLDYFFEKTDAPASVKPRVLEANLKENEKPVFDTETNSKVKVNQGNSV